MPFTRQVSDAITVVNALVKNVGNWATMQVQAADMVSSEMWYVAPWKFNNVVTSIASGAIPLVNGVQDYDPPAQIGRLLAARIIRTDVSPNEVRDIDVENSLVPDPKPRSFYAINAISLEQAVGQLRLEAAVQVPSGTTMEIGGEFQLMHNKITSTSAPLWFPDEYFPVFLAGMMTWAYQLADDPRRNDQEAKFKLMLEAMKQAEDYGGDEQLFPSESLGGTYMPGGIWGIY